MKEPLNNASDDLIHRIKGEFVEMPGLRLTVSQARRLWGLAHEDCERVLEALVNVKFLFRGTDGKFGRLTEDSAGSASPRMAKADLDPAGKRASPLSRRHSN